MISQALALDFFTTAYFTSKIFTAILFSFVFFYYRYPSIQKCTATITM